MATLSLLNGGRPAWWRGRAAVIGIPYVWLLAFFLAPFLIVLKYSVSKMGDITVQDVTSVESPHVPSNDCRKPIPACPFTT